MSKAMYVVHGILLFALYAKNYSQFLTWQISVHVSRPAWQQTLAALHQTEKVIPTQAPIQTFIPFFPSCLQKGKSLFEWVLIWWVFIDPSHSGCARSPPHAPNHTAEPPQENRGPYLVSGATPCWLFQCLIQVSNIPTSCIHKQVKFNLTSPAWGETLKAKHEQPHVILHQFMLNQLHVWHLMCKVSALCPASIGKWHSSVYVCWIRNTFLILR